MIEVFLVNAVVVAVVVILHYKFLTMMTSLMPRMTIAHQFRIVLGVFGALIAHTLEVWVFAAAYYFLHHSEYWGTLSGDHFDGGFMDCVYFSFTTFTTLGFGDIEPLGDLRYLTGFESLTGLVLITWTASFLYLEMRRRWDAK